MFLPVQNETAHTRTTVTAFGGYHHTRACGEGEFYEECNLSSRDYPAVGPRRPRCRVAKAEKPHGLFSKNGLLWIDGCSLHYRPNEGEEVVLENAVSDTDKTFCGLGTRVLIWPDKAAFDVKTGKLAPLSARWDCGESAVSIGRCEENGGTYALNAVGTTLPDAPDDGDYWLYDGAGANVLKRYSAAADSWTDVATTYLRIEAAGIGKELAVFDTVTLSGIPAGLYAEAAEQLNTDLIVWNRGDDYIVVTGLLHEDITDWKPAAGALTAERRIPDLDFLTECNNRIWGCSSKDHAIYACKLGDPTNWFSYMGTAADSYAVTVGSDGDFTGMATCLGYVLAFKQNTLHKLYGTKPSDFQLTAITCRGVQPGCAKSLCILDEALYYKADDGVMVYDGSLPSCVSAALGDVYYTDAAAGAAGGCYYLAMRGRDGAARLFCYDTRRAVWHCEETAPVMDFAKNGAELYFLCADGAIWAVGGASGRYDGDAAQESAVEWSAETGDIGIEADGFKYLARLALRLEAEAGAQVRVDVQYDSSGVWERAAAHAAAKREALTIPLVPRRYDHLRLKISGRGEVRLRTLSRTYCPGSDVK